MHIMEQRNNNAIIGSRTETLVATLPNSFLFNNKKIDDTTLSGGDAIIEPDDAEYLLQLQKLQSAGLRITNEDEAKKESQQKTSAPKKLSLTVSTSSTSGDTNDDDDDIDWNAGRRVILETGKFTSIFDMRLQRKGKPKKRVKFVCDEQLAVLRVFDCEPNERINVFNVKQHLVMTEGGLDIKKFEAILERGNISEALKHHEAADYADDLASSNDAVSNNNSSSSSSAALLEWYCPPKLDFDSNVSQSLRDIIAKPAGMGSTEKLVEEVRQKFSIGQIYHDIARAPPSPDEPDDAVAWDVAPSCLFDESYRGIRRAPPPVVPPPQPIIQRHVISGDIPRPALGNVGVAPSETLLPSPLNKVGGRHHVMNRNPAQNSLIGLPLPIVPGGGEVRQPLLPLSTVNSRVIGEADGGLSANQRSFMTLKRAVDEEQQDHEMFDVRGGGMQPLPFYPHDAMSNKINRLDRPLPSMMMPLDAERFNNQHHPHRASFDNNRARFPPHGMPPPFSPGAAAAADFGLIGGPRPPPFYRLPEASPVRPHVAVDDAGSGPPFQRPPRVPEYGVRSTGERLYDSRANESNSNYNMPFAEGPLPPPPPPQLFRFIGNAGGGGGAADYDNRRGGPYPHHHHEHQGRTRPPPPQAFQEVCRHFINGFCRLGHRCKFAHPPQHQQQQHGRGIDPFSNDGVRSSGFSAKDMRKF